jgi:hypothetical protein
MAAVCTRLELTRTARWLQARRNPAGWQSPTCAVPARLCGLLTLADCFSLGLATGKTALLLALSRLGQLDIAEVEFAEPIPGAVPIRIDKYYSTRICSEKNKLGKFALFVV